MSGRTGVRGFLQGALDGAIAARQKQVNRYVNGALIRLDDATLEAHGYSRSELEKRATGYMF